jgi:hypothetical protein
MKRLQDDGDENSSSRMLALNDDLLQTRQGVTLAGTVRLERFSKDSACAATFPMTMAMRKPPAMVAKY